MYHGGIQVTPPDYTNPTKLTVSQQELIANKGGVVQAVVWLFRFLLDITTLVYLLNCTSHFNHVDKYYAFPSPFRLNTCSAGDNYTHARTVDTRLIFSPPTKRLGPSKPELLATNCDGYVIIKALPTG